jgi:hypothetical protein
MIIPTFVGLFKLCRTVQNIGFLTPNDCNHRAATGGEAGC